MWPNPQFPADLVTFTEEIFNGKLHFLCSAFAKIVNGFQPVTIFTESYPVIFWSVIFPITDWHAILYSLKTSENQRFSDVFRENRIARKFLKSVCLYKYCWPENYRKRANFSLWWQYSELSSFSPNYLLYEPCNFTKSNTPPWEFFIFLKLYKWYQMAQRIIFEQTNLSSYWYFTLLALTKVLLH